MTEKVRGLADYIGPYIKEAASPIKPAVHSLVEALRNFFRPMVMSSARQLRREELVSRAQIMHPSPFIRFLAWFPH